MARINIEDKFWIEIIPLVLALGNQDHAVGQAVRFFRFAQEKHREGKLITEAEFSKNGFTEALLSTFAERTEAGIKCLGAEKHFGWLEKRAAAGAKGGRSKTEAKTRNLKQNRSKNTEAPPKQNRSKKKQIEASPSISISPSFSSSNSSNENSSNSKPQAFVSAYCQRFKARWDENPQITGKEAGIAKRLAKSMSLERFEVLLSAFFDMPDAWLVKNKHPLNLFESKLNEIVVFAGQGKFTTAKQAHQADDMASTFQMLKDVREGKL